VAFEKVPRQRSWEERRMDDVDMSEVALGVDVVFHIVYGFYVE